VIDMEVFFEGMDLQEWFDLLLEGKLAGTGKLYGRMPVQIRPDAGKKLHFGEGFLYAAPGKGEIRMLQFEVGEEVVRQALGGDQPIWQLRAARDNVLEAFRHFEYTMLRFDFRREGGLFVCRAATAGKGVKGQKQEVNLNVNLFGFDDALNNAILVKTGSDSALDRAIDRFFGR